MIPRKGLSENNSKKIIAESSRAYQGTLYGALFNIFRMLHESNVCGLRRLGLANRPIASLASNPNGGPEGIRTLDIFADNEVS